MAAKRVYGLDIVRAIAVLSVVYAHGMVLLPDNIKTIAAIPLDGVTVFFVLSGFLIGSILLKTLEKEGNGAGVLLNFMYKRWFRTLPPYFLVLGFITFYALILNSRPGFTLLEIRRYVLFIQNLNWPHPSFFPEAWSLAVEEWFYLLVPFSAFALCRFLPPKKAVLLLTLLVILAVPVIRYLKSGTVDSLETWDMLLRKQVVTRLDSIVFGLLGAWLHYYYNAFWLRFRQPAFIIGLLILIFTGFTEGRWPGFYFNVLSFSLAALGVLLTLPFMHNIKQGAGAVYHFLTHISHVSYSMYLLHYTLVLHLLVPGTVALFPLAGWTLDYGLYWLYSFILASFMYAFFEKPVMKLRNKLELKKATV